MRREMNIVTYFGKERLAPDPFYDLKKKRLVYYALFEQGRRRGFNMFISTGKMSYLGNMTFNNILRYDGDFKFSSYSQIVTADAVFDRSGGLLFPPRNVSTRVLNGIDFKKLCIDKNVTYELLYDFMPKSFKVKNTDQLIKALNNFSQTDLVVLKPSSTFGGKGIVIGTPHEIGATTLNKDYVYSLQEFVDTSQGISGLVNGYHDLRIIVVNGKMVFCHIRQPRPGTLLANVAQGGSIKEFNLKDVPDYILLKAKQVQKIIDAKYDKPLYSIDFGVQNNSKAFVFELNNQIGFPDETMNYSEFISSLLDAMERISLNSLPS